LIGIKPIQQENILPEGYCLIKRRSGIVLLMSAPVAELLNTIRSSAVNTPKNRELLSVADMLEAIFTSLEKNLNQTHKLLSQEQAEKQAIKEKMAEVLLKNLALEERLRLSVAQRFGKSSERWLPADTSQGLLFNELEECLLRPESQGEPEPEPEATQEKSPPKARGKRASLPKDLPRKETYLDIPENEKMCACGQHKVKIGEEVSEQLQIIPATKYVEKTIRPIYACSGSCEGVCYAPVPASVYPKSIMGETVLASIITNKFCDALPFNRQERILQRIGIELSRQTMARGAKAVAIWLLPLLLIIDQRLAKCRVLCADETRLRVLKQNGLKKDGNSYMWVIRGEDSTGVMVKFHYGGGREAEIARELLQYFSGFLMCDAYGAYPPAVANLPIKLAACMAHVRRKFHDILKANSKDPHAQKAIKLIAALYVVEKEAKFMSPAERLALRQEKSVPAFETFKSWLYERARECAPQSSLGKAVSYTVNLLDRLAVYLSDGEVPIDNNAAENAIRPFVVGRKNWLFSAEAEGAKASGALYTIIETAKANYLEPMHYLLFLFRCYKKFGPKDMPWQDLQPRKDLREYAEKIDVPWIIA
jgi:transposase